MSANAALLSCPVCSHKHFDSADALREKLIFVSNNKLACPICQEEMLGLDKLTIHLFCHVKVELSADKVKSDVTKEAKSKSTSKQENLVSSSANSKKSRQTSKTKTTSATNPVKFVKICPKPSIISLNTVPLIEITQQPPKPTSTNLKQALFFPCVQPPCVLSKNLSNEQICTAFRCDICGITFKDENMLTMHKNLIHNIEQVKMEEMSSFPCHMCSKVFKMRGSLMVHLRVAHYGIIAKKTVTPNNFDDKTLISQDNRDDKNNEIYDDVKGWYCDICQKSFTTKYFLKKHKRLHTGETPYACNICGKTFTFQQSYHKHLLYHNDEKPHSCSYCGRSFKELSTLHNHQRIHTGEKPFECETCGKCFRQRVSYLVHRRIHTGAMPYKCTSCEKSFRYKVSQRTHKCPAQPPGTVVRRTGDLLEMLIKRQNSADPCPQPQIPLIPMASEANVEMARTGAKLSLEDTEAENFSFITKSPFEAEDVSSFNPNCNGTASIPSTDTLSEQDVPEQENVPSPSEILKNLCLSNGGDSSPRDLFYENDINIQDFCREIDRIF